MPKHKTSIRLLSTLAVLTFNVIGFSTGASAQQERVLYSFNGYLGPSDSFGSVIFDKAGNIYGTASQGGAYNLGAAWELSPNGSGGFTQTVLHSFNYKNDSTDGWGPRAGLALDTSGNLYGTTAYGGINDDGIIFELSPAGGGTWTETILHTFDYSVDGEQPSASLIFDSVGNLYGTTSYGGTGTGCGLGCGTVFELSPQTGGGWSLATLHTFNGDGTDGFNPLYGALVFDSKGNIYGTTVEGGTGGDGVVFELSPQAGGGWSESILHNFTGVEPGGGIYPNGGVVFDAKGNLYGTTREGGNASIGYGTVYELSPAADGSWTEGVLFNCAGGVGGTLYPGTSLIFDSRGDLYGTSVQGGDGWGNVFALRSTSKGWVERTVHSFQNNRKDGIGPYDALIVGPSGNLYGTTSGGGLKLGGTVFEIIP